MSWFTKRDYQPLYLTSPPQYSKCNSGRNAPLVPKVKEGDVEWNMGSLRKMIDSSQQSKSNAWHVVELLFPLTSSI